MAAKPRACVLNSPLTSSQEQPQGHSQSSLSQRLSRDERLRGTVRVQRLMSEGVSGFIYPFRFVYMLSPLRNEAVAKLAECAEECIGGQAEVQGCDLSIDADEVTQLSSGEEFAANLNGLATRVAILFSVPKRKHKRANRRNHLRRRMKEAYRLQKSNWPHLSVAAGASIDGPAQRLDIALIYSVSDQLTFKTIDRAIRKIILHISCEAQS